MAEPEPVGQPPERPRRPPVPAPEQAHGRGDKQHADDRGVDEHGDCHAHADALDRDRFGERKGREDDDHDERRAGDHPGRPRQALGDRGAVVVRASVGLLDARQEQDFVVHRQPEQDAEHDDRIAGYRESGRLEAEHVAQVAVLEDKDYRAVGRPGRKQVEDNRLDCNRQRPEDQQQYHEAQT